ncbi:MAG: hypothetical protein KDJ48_07940 [Nitratireductor sp.]|nr:hypothetical protein [Nitratireductor sp.]
MANFQQDILAGAAAPGHADQTTTVQIALFASFGVLTLFVAPSLVISVSAVILLSLSAVAMASASIADPESGHYRNRSHTIVGAALLAMCLWLAMSIAHTFALPWALHVAAAMMIFVSLLLAEAVFSTLAAFAFGQVSMRDPAIALAVLVDRKYGGIAGKLV